ncbi:MAG: hypothetical protein HY319_18475 [Armatimonadetes bacterium]|nr:hypothetical protein [Armatimonadota bacterium]
MKPSPCHSCGREHRSVYSPTYGGARRLYDVCPRDPDDSYLGNALHSAVDSGLRAGRAAAGSIEGDHWYQNALAVPVRLAAGLMGAVAGLTVGLSGQQLTVFPTS